MLCSDETGGGRTGHLCLQKFLGRRDRHVDGGCAYFVDRLRLGPRDLVLGLLGAALESCPSDWRASPRQRSRLRACACSRMASAS